jgi:hypothetical protein
MINKMKNLTKIAFGMVLIGSLVLTSCNAKKDMAGTANDMYYSPSAARKAALAEERRMQKELAEREANGFSSSNSLQSQSNQNQGNTIINNNYYESDFRMNYGGYFNRFGGYRPMMNPGFGMGMGMMNPRTNFWMGYNNFGMGMSPMMGYGMGMGFGSPMMGFGMSPFYDPFCPWGGMGMGMMGNPFMMDPWTMNRMGYNNGFMNGYMAGSMGGGMGWSGNNANNINRRPQPVMQRRTNYGSNQMATSANTRRAVNNRGVSANAPNQNSGTIQSRSTNTRSSSAVNTNSNTGVNDNSRRSQSGTINDRSTNRSSSSSSSGSSVDRRGSSSNSNSNIRNNSTPSRSYSPPPSSSGGSSRSTHSAPSSRGSSGGGSSSGGSSSGGGSRGGRR